MLPLAFWLLAVTAVLGSALAAMHLRGTRVRWQYGMLHGLLGVIGFAGLLLALRGPPRGAAVGVAGFGSIAAVLLAIALLAGVAIPLLRLRRRRVASPIIGIHATVAIGGLVILAAYVLMG